MEAKRARIALLASALITLALYSLPQGRYVIYPLLLLSTFVHELGHGLTALLVGGEFFSLRIWADGSGIAMMYVEPGWRSALASAGGLAGPAIAAALCFLAARSARLSRFSLWIFGAFCLVVALWVVRNPVGWAVAGVTGTVCILIARFGNDEVRRVSLVFFAIQLALSVFSNSDYLFKKSAKTGAGLGASDVSNIADHLFGPYWFWGFVVGVFSVATVGVGLYVNLRSGARKHTRTA